jgi:hypothetical protein
MRTFAAITLACAISSLALAQKQVIVVQDTRPTLSDALGTLAQQLRQQELARAEAERARAETEKIRAETAAINRATANAAVASMAPQPIALPPFTAGFANGRLWAQMDETNKLVYVMALSEGRIALKDKLALDEKSTHDSVVKWLDWFYSKPEYAAIPVVWAHLMFMQRQSPEVMQKMIDDYLINLAVGR